MSNTDPDALLNATNAVKFEKIGDTVKGVVLRKAASQQTDYGSNVMKYWPNGDPMMQVLLDLDVGGGEERRLYVKGGVFTAVKKALDGRTIEIGSTLAVQYVSDGLPSKPGFSPPKQFRAEYAPPAPSAAADTGTSVDSLI